MNSLTKGCIVLALAFGAGTALAADLPTHKAPPMPVYAEPTINWTGFYLGLNGGFAGDAFRYPFEIGNVTGSGKLNSSGFLGGVTAGFNWQFAPTWVAGFEGDIDLANINGKLTAHASNPGNTLDLTAGSTTHYIDTARLRLGYLVTPQFLLFGTGGAAYGDTASSIGVSYNGNDLLGGPYSKTVTGLGWTAGAGAEYKITKNLSFKTEYLYTDLGTQTLYSNAAIPASLKVHTTDNQVRAGLNWTFN
jgi:outer membrane immunogenic protein